MRKRKRMQMDDYYEEDYGESYGDDEDWKDSLDPVADWNMTESFDAIDDSKETDELDAELEKRYGGGNNKADGVISLNAAGNKKSSDQVYENFKRYYKMLRSEDPEQIAEAKKGATDDLEGFVESIINKKFYSYVKKKPELRDDLKQEGRVGILEQLERYDPEKARPTTFFYNPILHEMSEFTTQSVHYSKPHVTSTKKKIMKIQEKFKQYGRVPTIHDYVYLSGDPWKRVEEALSELNAGNVMNSIYDPNTAAAVEKVSNSCSPAAEAMSNMNVEALFRIVDEIETDPVRRECFKRHYMDEVKLATLADEYGLSLADVSASNNKILDTMRHHYKVLKLYPEYNHVSESVLKQSINLIPIEEGSLAMNDLLDSLGEDDEEDDLDFDPIAYDDVLKLS